MSAPKVINSISISSKYYNFEKTVVKALKYVPKKYLIGLDTIELVEASKLNRNARRKKIGNNVSQSKSLGYYTQAFKGEPPSITIHIDNIFSNYSWFTATFLRFYLITLTLYHEIGHHIHLEIEPEHRNKEFTANEYRNKLRGIMVRRKYWYIGVLLYPLLLFKKKRLLGKSFKSQNKRI